MNLLKHPRIAFGAFSIALAFSLLGGAAIAQASTLTSEQVQAITSLLQAFGVDSATIANVQSVLENQPIAASSTPSSGSDDQNQNQAQNGAGCSAIAMNLRLGATDQSTGGEVSHLQSFLGKDPSIYPEDAVTGYFGTSTLQAVQRWQAAHGIVSSGDPESTGYGSVGPQTRGEMDKEMETECAGGSSHDSLGGTASSTESQSAGENGDSSHSASSTPSGGGDN